MSHNSRGSPDSTWCLAPLHVYHIPTCICTCSPRLSGSKPNNFLILIMAPQGTIWEREEIVAQDLACMWHMSKLRLVQEMLHKILNSSACKQNYATQIFYICVCIARANPAKSSCDSHCNTVLCPQAMRSWWLLKDVHPLSACLLTACHTIKII